MATSHYNGVFQINSDLASLEKKLEAQQLSIFKVYCDKTTTKETLLKQIAQTLDFPDYFEKNWDALHECLSDLQWLNFRGVVLVFEQSKLFFEEDAESFKTLVAVLESVSKYWNAKQKTFMALFYDPIQWDSNLLVLSIFV